MSLLVRALLYTACLFLVMVVYTAQKHTNARDTLHSAIRGTGRMLLWSVIAVVVMLVLEELFIS